MDCDVIVIGGGIAGASAAAEIAAARRVILLERESQPGYHTTARSAALLTPYYGTATVRGLNLAGGRFYAEPPQGFAEVPLLAPRGELYIGRKGEEHLVDEEADRARSLGGDAEILGVDATLAMVPILRREWIGAVWYDASAADMDVGAILQGYIRLLRHRGGELRTDAEALALSRAGDGWAVTTPKGIVRAPVVVNAAGAWADTIADMAGVGGLGVQPMRRTMVIVAPPPGHDTRRWPGCADVREKDGWYFKADAGRLMCSPADETPSEPCDAQPDELDIAITIDRVQQAADLPVRRVEHSWAGLRSFSPDRTPIVGFDPRSEGFFWLAGQGGFGIMTAPSLSTITAHLVAGVPLPRWLGEHDLAKLAPDRFIAAS